MAPPLIKVGGGYIEITPDFSKFKTAANRFNNTFGDVGKNAGQAFVKAFQRELNSGLAGVGRNTVRSLDPSNQIADGAKKSAKSVVFAWNDAANQIRFINKKLTDSQIGAFNSSGVISDLRKVSQEYKTQAAVIQQGQNAQKRVDDGNRRAQLAAERAAQAEMTRLHTAASAINRQLDREQLAAERAAQAENTRLHTQAIALNRQHDSEVKRLANDIRGTYTSALKTAQAAYTNLAGAQRTISTTNTQINRTFVDFVRNLDQVRTEMDKTTKSATDFWSIGNRMIGLGQQITQNITVPFIGATAIIAKFGLDSATALEGARGSLGALIGGPNSAREAQQELDRLAKFAQTTNFDLKGLQTSAVQLQAAGLSATEAETSIRAFGNAAGVSRLNADQFNRIMIALAQSYGAVKVNAQDMKQIQDATLPIWRLMADATGKSEQELRALSKAGDLLAKDVFPVLNNYLLTNAKYANGAEKAAQTLGGKLQNLQEIFKYKLGLAFEDNQKSISSLIASFGKMLDALIPAVTSALPTLITIFKGFTTVVSTLASVFQAMPGWARTGVTILVSAVAILGPVLIGLGIAIKTTTVGITGLSAAFTRLGQTAAGSAISSGLTSAFTFVQPYIGAAIVGITALVAVYQLWSQSSQEATARQQALTAAIEQDNGALGENTRQAVVNAIEKQKIAPTDANALQIAQKLGINLKTLTDAYLGNGQAVSQVSAQLRQYIATQHGTSDADVGRRLAAIGLLNTLQEQQGTLKGAVQDAKNHAAAMGTDTNATKQDATAQQGLAGAANAASNAVSIQTQELYKAFQAKTADVNAAYSYRSALSSLGDQIKANSGSLSENTRDGIANRQSAFSAIDLAFKQAQAMADQNATAEQVNTALRNNRNALYSLMVQTGANTNAVRAFLDAYFQIPQSRTVTLNVQVKQTVLPSGVPGSDPSRYAPNTPKSTPTYKPPNIPNYKYQPPTSAAQSAAKAAADQAKAAAKAAAEQKRQQEKAFQGSGSSLLKAFAKGLDADAPTLRNNLDQLADSIRQAFDTKGASGVNALLGKLNALGNKLVSLAKQRDAIYAKIKEAQDFGTSVTASIKSSAALTNLPYSTTTPTGILVGLQSRLASIKNFGKVIKDLTSRGLSKSLLRQVIEAGPIEGTQLGQAILSADKATFKAINDAQKQIDAQAKALGGVAADSVFGSVAAMQKRGADLQKQMEGIAKQAIKLVGNAFNLGWRTINNITKSGMSVMNSSLKDHLGTTTKAVSNATKTNQTAWTAMVGNMNSSTKSLVNVTYGKGVAPTINAMAGLAGVKAPLPKLAFSDGGVVPGYAPRIDDVPAMLSKGEGVMVPEFVRQVGADTINAWNAAARKGGNLFASGGIVGGDEWVTKHKNDPFKGYDDALSSALKSVVDPTVKTLSTMAGAFSKTEAADVTTKGYTWLHTWAKKMDKLANSGGSATAVLNVARGELGGPGSHSNKYNSYNNEPWCGDFLSWIVDHAHANKAYWNSPTPTPSHRWGLADTWNHPGDRVAFNKAQPGDVINWPGQHVGIVEKAYGNGSVGTIEGNHDPRFVVRATRGNGVLSRPHWSSLPNTNGEQPVNPWPGSAPTGGIDGNIPKSQWKNQNGNSPSQNKNLGMSILKNLGWQSYWNAVNYIFTRESGWNHHATNPSSGAYGIPQALPGSKMRSSGADWRVNPVTQIFWGLNYMKTRYGSPGGALSFWKSHNWYENGAWDVPGTQAAVLHRGEMVVPEQPAEAFRDALARTKSPDRGSPDSGVTYAITINAAPDVPTEKTIIKALSYAHTMYGRG